jgi:hypothetical protein
MRTGLARAWDALWGRGEYSVTVPSMDGALRPNTRLDEASTVVEAAGVDDLAIIGRRLYFSQGDRLMALDQRGDAPRLVEVFPSPISALAASTDGRLAIGFDAGGVVIRKTPEDKDGAVVALPADKASPTALAFAADGSLLICIGSLQNRASEWKRDLMMLGSTGAVWRVPSSGGKTEILGQRMSFPIGATMDANGEIIVSEAWKHRLVRRSRAGAWEPVLTDIPGYPGRIKAAAGSGYWLCIFAPRGQMIEFILREKGFRERMISNVPEEFWMAPTLRAGLSFKEPLQGGGVKHLGIHKPWGPTRSYGLVVKLDAHFQPVSSWHSRSDGTRHGITSALDWNGEAVVASKGNGVIVALEKPADGRPA